MTPAKVILEYAHKVSEAAKLLDGYTDKEALNAYRAGLLKAIELLQAEYDNENQLTKGAQDGKNESH